MFRSPLVLVCLALACGKSGKKSFDPGSLEGSGGALAGAGGALAGAGGVAGTDAPSNSAGEAGTEAGAGGSSTAGSAGGGVGGVAAGGAGVSNAGAAGDTAGFGGDGTGAGGDEGDAGAANTAGTGGDIPGSAGAPPNDVRYDDFMVRSRAMAQYEGLRVFVTYRNGRGFNEAQSAVVTSGVFEVGWREGFDRQTFGAIVDLFVDRGSDGECTERADPAWRANIPNASPRGQIEIFEFDPNTENPQLAMPRACSDVGRN